MSTKCISFMQIRHPSIFYEILNRGHLIVGILIKQFMLLHDLTNSGFIIELYNLQPFVCNFAFVVPPEA